jgi:dipeptidase E
VESAKCQVWNNEPRAGGSHKRHIAREETGGRVASGVERNEAPERDHAVGWAEPGVKALLISSSKIFGRGYLDHAEAAIRELLTGVRRVLFIPHALADRDAYAETARTRFERMGLGLDSLHTAPDPRAAVEAAEVAFVGGGNTFRLLKALSDLGVLEPLRARALTGMPYVGASAGTNVACPTVRTTNDMPIVEPPSLTALGLVRFQVNPHYLDPDPSSRHMGETREERLLQYLEENDVPAVGLREPSTLRIEGAGVTLLGAASARIFRRGMAPFEVAPGARLDEHLG